MHSLASSVLLFLSLFDCVVPLASTTPYPAHYVPAIEPCHNISALGMSIFCVGSGKCIDGTELDQPGKCQYYNNACSDTNMTCPSAQVEVGLNGFGNRYHKYVNAGLGSCDKTAFQDYNWERLQYSSTCCSCPPGYVPASTLCAGKGYNADGIYRCAGCKNRNDKLSADRKHCIPSGTCPSNERDDSTSCTQNCPTLTTVTAAHLTGPQVVVSQAFAEDVLKLVDCARSAAKGFQGDKAGLFAQSSSRCGRSPRKSEVRAKGTSAHQIGRALDTNLFLPGGAPCNKTCMGKAYCAFHKTDAVCVNGGSKVQGGSPKNPDNIFVRDFFRCAESIPGLSVGARIRDWNHFMRDVKSRKAVLHDYQVQLKAFCHNGCNAQHKGAVTKDACTCAAKEKECCLDV